MRPNSVVSIKTSVWKTIANKKQPYKYKFRLNQNFKMHLKNLKNQLYVSTKFNCSFVMCTCVRTFRLSVLTELMNWAFQVNLIVELTVKLLKFHELCLHTSRECGVCCCCCWVFKSNTNSVALMLWTRTTLSRETIQFILSPQTIIWIFIWCSVCLQCMCFVFNYWIQQQQ